MRDRMGPNEPRGICPWCGSAISTVVRDDTVYARCSHRGCGARGPTMQDERRACELFANPPPTARQRAHHTEIVDAMRDALAKIAHAETALGPAWMHGGVSLAEGIRRKTAEMERLALEPPRRRKRPGATLIVDYTDGAEEATTYGGDR